jgi:hypothetical protein
MVTDWLSAFVFTQVLEVPIYFWALKRRADAHEGDALWRTGFAFLASMATHPYVWFVIPSLFYSRMWDALTYTRPWLEGWRYPLFFVTAESFAVVVEAMILRGLRVPRPFLWALVANAFSAFSGILVRELTGWP